MATVLYITNFPSSARYRPLLDSNQSRGEETRGTKRKKKREKKEELGKFLRRAFRSCFVTQELCSVRAFFDWMHLMDS